MLWNDDTEPSHPDVKRTTSSPKKKHLVTFGVSVTVQNFGRYLVQFSIKNINHSCRVNVYNHPICQFDVDDSNDFFNSLED